MSKVQNGVNQMYNGDHISITNIGQTQEEQPKPKEKANNDKKNDNQDKDSQEAELCISTSNSRDDSLTKKGQQVQQKLMNQLKIVNGRYQYPMRGRQLPSVQSSDLFYDTRIPINRGKSPNIIFTREAKYFDLSLKEQDQKLAPSTYRPREAITRCSNASYSMSRSQKKCHFDKVIGEGAQRFYKVQQEFSKDIKHGCMGRSTRKFTNSVNLMQTAPAPGQYNSKNDMIRPQQVVYKFNQSIKNCMKEMLTITDPEVEVGPGKYNQMNATHSLKNLRTRGGVIGTARKYEIEVNENPSPGQYHKHQYRNTARCVSIGRANLNESIRSDIIPMGNFGFINKNVINSSQLGPDLGPGSYNTLDVKLAGKTVKNPMKGAHSFQKQLKYMENAKSVTSLSGPGDYNLKIDCLNLSKYANTRTGGAIGKSGVKTDRFSWDTVEGPDPGKYQNNASFIMSPKNVKFGRSSKQLTVREKSPGPGTYNPKDTLTKRKNEPRVYTASVRNLNQYLTKNLMKETPGPGKYNKIDKPYKKISTDCKIGNSVRSDIILNENPGPGKYNPNKDVTKASAPSAKIALDQIDALVQQMNRNLSKTPRANLFTPVLSKNKPQMKATADATPTPKKSQPRVSTFSYMSETKSSSSKKPIHQPMNEQGPQQPNPLPQQERQRVSVIQKKNQNHLQIKQLMGGPKGLNLKLPLGENRGLTPTPRDMPTSTRASNSNRYAVSTQRGTKQTTNRYQEVDNCGKSPKDDIMEQFSREIDAEELIAI